jgi:hypothetical protein
MALVAASGGACKGGPSSESLRLRGGPADDLVRSSSGVSSPSYAVSVVLAHG